MKYNWNHIDESVAKNISENYELYLGMYESGSKLVFVKTIKEHNGLGLRESKDNADVIFGGGVQMFKNTFGLKEQRRRKLAELKTKLLVSELVVMISDSSVEKLESVFYDLDINVIEDILANLLNYKK